MVLNEVQHQFNNRSANPHKPKTSRQRKLSPSHTNTSCSCSQLITGTPPTIQTRMSKTARTVQLLQASVDESEESYFRFLVDGKNVKYVTIDAGLYAADDLCFAPTLVPLLPEFPAGDWNDGHIARSEKSGTPFFARTTKTRLPTIKSSWHPTCVDHLELSFGQKLRSGVYEAVSPRFRFPIVAKFARFAWEVETLDRECMAYRWIDGRNIGPKFLGLLTEEGRTVGFIIEKITDARHATPDELLPCQQTLSGLHNLGVLHGDVNKHNFLVKDGQAILIDFECARMSQDSSAFEKEMQRLSVGLGDTSGKGGSLLSREGP